MKSNPAEKGSMERKRLFYLIPSAACLLLLAGAFLFSPLPEVMPQKDPAENSYLQAGIPLMEVSMPEDYSYDDWETARKVWYESPVEKSFTDGLRTFSYETGSALLSGEYAEAENINYSPLSLYYALALAATGAEGETKYELLSILQVSDKETLATQCGNYFRRSHLNNEIGIRKIANSLWMDDSVSWKQDFIENAAENFYASVFSMDLQSEETAKAMSNWISEQTNGSLAPELSPPGVLTIINTVTFHDEWMDRFDKDKTGPDSFYLADGSSVTCDFMNRDYSSHGFAVGNGYIRSSLSLKNNTMIFILPDEGISLRSLIDTPEKMREAFEGGEEYDGGVIWQIPKFDFSSKLDLKDTLAALGVTSVFEGNADFSDISDGRVFFSEVTQGTHIAVDEDGADASAFTILDLKSEIPKGEADMRLTGPFLYGITGADGALLFVGICDNPLSN